jgi:hypothetical protein
MSWNRNEFAARHSAPGYLVMAVQEIPMLTWLIRNRLTAFERKFDYNLDYARALLAADRAAFFKFMRVGGISSYSRDVPRDVYHAVKLTGTVLEDCGPCTQLIVAMALRDGVEPRTIANVLAGPGNPSSPSSPSSPAGPARPPRGDAQLTDDVRLGVRFARAVAARDAAADELRDEIVRRWGPRALVSLAFALTAARIFPTIKYALGHGAACQRVNVAGETVVPYAHAHAAPAASAPAS